MRRGMGRRVAERVDTVAEVSSQRPIELEDPERRLTARRNRVWRWTIGSVALVSLVAAGGAVAHAGPPGHGRLPSKGHASHGPSSSDGSAPTSRMPAGEAGEHESHHGGEESGENEVFLPGTTLPRLLSGQRLSQEDHRELEAQAEENLVGGRARIVDGLRRLADAGDDAQVLEASLAEVYQGAREVSKGLALRRAMSSPETSEGRALKWIRQDLNLRPSTVALPPARGLGLFHAALMVVLLTFAAAMLWMYFFKMRRAAALLQSLDSAASARAPGRRTVAQPTREATWRGELEVAAVFEEADAVKTFRLREPEGGNIPFDFLPGQFLTLKVTPENKSVQRSYTIASSPTQRDYVEITVKRDAQGQVSRFLHDHVGEGDTLTIAAAPAGRFTFTGRESDSIVLIAGGVGITPMMSVIRYLTDRAWRGGVHLVACSRHERDVIFAHELGLLAARHANLRTTTVLSDPGDGWEGPRGRLTVQLLRELVPDAATQRVHLCGPPAMMDAVGAMLVEIGVTKDQIHTEKFGPARARPGESGKPATAPEPAGQKQLPTVSFRGSGKKTTLAADMTILDAAESVGVEIDNSCRVGTCGTCVVRLLEGEVTMAVEDGLHPDDKADGLILACQACAKADVVVDV